MIDVKEAVRKATEYLEELYSPSQLHDVLLEEVSLSDDEKYWFVTLGFSRPIPLTDDMRILTGNLVKSVKYQREYKVFEINSDTGQVRSMKIRAA